nr:protein NRT1/ PTR FAMILY 5.2-like [Ipomoea batatas]
MAYYGISSNLVLYLTRELHEGTVKSANNVTNWVGTVWMTPLIGAYIADTYLGRYWTFIIASAIYLMGMVLLTLAVSLKALKPPSCGNGIKDEDCKKHASSLQIGVFYLALYIIAIGTGGTKPNISTMGADQFDDFEPKERFRKLSFFNWWMFSIFLGTLFSNTILVYIQDNRSWSLGYAVPTVGLLVSVLVFVAGTPFYRHKTPSGSPLTRMAKVIVAAFLDKAAVESGESGPWRLCPVTQVEETKRMLKMVPILTATIIPSTVVAQAHTLFIKQGTTLKRHLGPGNFEIPPACLTAFITIFMLLSIVLYDRLFVPFIRRYTKNPRGIRLLQRMGIGLFIHVIVMVTAFLAERKRLSVAKENGIVKGIVPLSIFVLLPQFGLLGVADNFLEVGKLELFYDQAPEGMKSLGTAYFTTSLGVGFYLSSVILSGVADLTKRHGHQGWILDNLNVSRLDYYYAFCAVLSFLNLLFFLVVARNFSYNTEGPGELQEEAMHSSS